MKKMILRIFNQNQKCINLLFALFLLLLQSCIGNKDYIYLQNKGNLEKVDSVNQSLSLSSTYKLKAGDILYIRISTDDEKMNSLFNPLTNNGMNLQMTGTNGTPFYLMGYSVNNLGELDFPYIGKINVAGKTTDELKNLLEIEAKKYFKIVFVQVKLAEFRFSILGSVNRPGQYFFNVNHLNILEAIAMAGDVHENAKRTSVTLIRDRNGRTETHIINLTDIAIINSPFYQIQPNDIIYIQPVKSRSIGNISNFQNTLNTILPIFSTFLLVLNTYIILQNIK
jgi:polysaccharide export outer membrane protein